MYDLIERLEKWRSCRVALVGDFILDRYVYGDVERINPEAPVPVLKTTRGHASVGGAGNVAAAVSAMGGAAACIGLIGRDGEGEELIRLLSEAGASSHSLIRLSERRTALKTRYVGLAQHRHAQQMLRVDDEAAGPLGPHVQASIRSALGGELPTVDIVAIEDYNKGVLDDEFTPQLIADAAAAGKRVIVDPACIADYRRYRGATVIKPNRYEASMATGIDIDGEASLEAAAKALVEQIGAEAAVITLDREGAYLYRRGGTGKRIPHARPRAVYDVTGAGDQTLAVLALALAQECTYEQAVELANIAGGLEVERSGFVPISREEMDGELRRMIGLRGQKVHDRRQLAAILAERKRLGQSVVFTNGCFDLLHMGHVRYLRQARELGSCLVVAINSDESVRRLKGPERPVIGQGERAEMLGALECVDYVTVFDEDTPMELLTVLRPDILAKGGSTPVVVGREFVESYGGKVLTLDLVEGQSTTQIINRIVNGGK